MGKRGFDEIDQERLDVAEAATSRLLQRFKAYQRTAPADRRRLELIEEALSSLGAARLVK